MRLLRIRQVIQVTGLSRMTIYRMELAGKFPRRRRLNENSVAWLETDISDWVGSRPMVLGRTSPADPRHNRRDA
jgi:prophage regulatory protein